jgi:hypothetical protein
LLGRQLHREAAAQARLANRCGRDLRHVANGEHHIDRLEAAGRRSSENRRVGSVHMKIERFPRRAVEFLRGRHEREKLRQRDVAPRHLLVALELRVISLRHELVERHLRHRVRRKLAVEFLVLARGQREHDRASKVEAVLLDVRGVAVALDEVRRPGARLRIRSARRRLPLPARHQTKCQRHDGRRTHNPSESSEVHAGIVDTGTSKANRFQLPGCSSHRRLDAAPVSA